MNTSLAETAPPGFVRAVPLVASAGLTRVPLLLVFGYVVSTFAMFLIWPINWPIYYLAEWARLIGYVTLCFIVVGAAALVGSSGATRLTAPLPHLRLFMIAGAITAVLLLVPASFAYTGRGPWEMLEALGDQGAAYRRLQIQLWTTEGQRNTIAAMRATAAPLTFAVLPLGIIHWRGIGLTGRVAVVVTVLSSIIFSILRGTDKEIADLFVIGSAAAFVSYGRSRTLGYQGFDLVRRYWKPALLALASLYFAVGLFTERKDARLGGYVSRTAVCANESRICANLDNPWISWLPHRQRFGFTFFILSTSSGYYGLALALEKPFESAYGIGHSPASLSVYEVLTGDKSVHMRTFTYRNGADRWSEEHYWSTLITWIANDVGFAGAVLVLGLVGYLWGRWWREAAAGMSDPAAMLFVLASTMMFYLPANNQVLASYDGYTVLAVWLGIWLWHRRARGLSAIAGG
ncbi:MAG TPA: hypothetical protein VMN38_06890 [Sphingomicrobium sp.]|nr:hypothetical protein [Sphingomicrobium sp.]